MVILSVSVQLHPGLHAVHIENFNNTWSLFEILQEQTPRHLSQVFRVSVRNRGESPFDNFHDKTSLILRFKRMLKRT